MKNKTGRPAPNIPIPARAGAINLVDVLDRPYVLAALGAVPVTAVELRTEYCAGSLNNLVVSVQINNVWVKIIRAATEHQGMLGETVYLRNWLTKSSYDDDVY